jgi:CubicO group peptidase (beta-lactamase class C family)
MSYDTVTSITDRMRPALQADIDRGYLPGAVALVSQGEDCSIVALGQRSLGDTSAMDADAIFRISSMTKPVTAVAILQLIEDGRLSLDEPVERLLPELANRRVLARVDGPLDETVPVRRAMTVEDLLTFRSGWGLVLAPPDTTPLQRRISELGLIGFGPPDPASPVGPDQWLARLGSLPLMAQPGERWLYNTSACILGVLAARAAGRSLAEHMEERIFEPLGMKDTAFHIPPTKVRRFGSAYRSAAGLELADPAVGSAWSKMPAFADGSAGLVSTAADFLNFSRMLLGGGEYLARRVLSEASVAAMTRNYLSPDQRTAAQPFLTRGFGWGYGTSVIVDATDERIPVGSWTWCGGLGTSWVADPRTRTTAILMTQTMFDSPNSRSAHERFWLDAFS